MIHCLADGLWHVPHAFKVNGLPLTTRMTLVRLPCGGLWLHSPVPLGPGLRAAVQALGPVRHIVAPSKTHHLFLTDCARAFPEAALFGAPGLAQKRPDVAGLRELSMDAGGPWPDELAGLLFEGIPFANETLWFHHRSRTLIVTDLLQWWQGDMALSARLYARLTGVRQSLAVPRTVRLLVRDREAARRCARRILDWPFERVVVAHNAVVEIDARRQVEQALACWL
ncbi:DUF4336 domain-containing protein [Ideonella sp.]|uniref:DUF4336 domain-containing protein n=1 Tax=Ideonella sp. TaxID=1929293 RepID=UPI0035B14B2C